MASPTLLDLFIAWQTAKAPAKQSVRTLQAQDRDTRMIAQRMLEVTSVSDDADDVDPRTLVRLVDLTIPTLRGAFASFAGDHAHASIARALSTWSVMCRFGVAEGLLDVDPTVGIQRPKVRKGAPKPLAPLTPQGSTEATAAQLLAWLESGQRSGYDVWPERDRAVMVLMLVTGVRSAEARSLLIQDLNGGPGEWRIAVVGKGNKARSIPIRDALVSILAVYLSSREARLGRFAPSAHLFVDRHGRPLTEKQLQYLVRECCRAAGVGDALPQGAIAHALRHTVGTLLAGSGAPATDIMRLLGHESLATSQGYIDAVASQLRASAVGNPLYDHL